MMKTRLGSPIVLCVTLWLGVPCLAKGLDAYLERPDSSFRWALEEERRLPAGRVYDLRLVSQTWQGMEWEHELQVYEPREVEYPDTVLLLVTGGRSRNSSVALGFQLAERSGMRVAGLYQIPRQPLFDGRTEDALIAYTFLRYLETGDAGWPLLFPMVKSAIRAMDALEAFAPEGWGAPVRRFIVAGGSKRGWTSWLAAAAGDPRVSGIVPIVIDTLNFPAQLKHQLESYGAYSEQIRDYVDTGLVDLVDTEPGRRLWEMVDPFSFRKRLTLPKMIVNGTNDPYWTQDALNLYWDDLRGPKSLLYIPNATHGLGEDLPRLLATTTAFCRHVATDRPMPDFAWSHGGDGDRLNVRMRAGDQARDGRLWTARSVTRDFRKSRWSSAPLRREGSEWIGESAAPEEGFVAIFGELDFEIDGRAYTLSTQIRIAGGR